MVFALTLMYWPWVSPEVYDYEVWKKFADKVGWRKKGRWLNYTELTSLEKHYSGHLPVAPFWGGVGVWFFSRASTCRY